MLAAGESVAHVVEMLRAEQTSGQSSSGSHVCNKQRARASPLALPRPGPKGPKVAGHAAAQHLHTCSWQALLQARYLECQGLVPAAATETERSSCFRWCALVLTLCYVHDL